MSDQPTFQIPRDVIEPIIQSHVSAAVVAALGDNKLVLESAISQVLNSKVDSSGKPSTYGYSSDVAYVQWLCQNAIKGAVQKVMTEEVGKHSEVIRQCLVKELKKSNSPLVKQLVEGFVKTITDETTLKYRLNITVEP